MDERDYEKLRAINFDEALAQFFAHRKHAVSTQKAYRACINRYATWARGQGVNPLAVDYRDMNAYLRVVYEKEVTQRTKHLEYMALKAFFSFIASRWRTVSPFTHGDILHPANPDDGSLRTYSPSYHAAIVQEAMELDAEEALPVLLIAINGLKGHELVSAEAEDLVVGDDSARLVLPRRQTGQSTPLIGPLRSMAKEVRAARAHGPLFVNQWGSRHDRSSIQRLLGKVARAADVPRPSAQTLRNTAASIALSHGLSPMGLQEMLGSRSTSIYRHLKHARREEEHGASVVLRAAMRDDEGNELLGFAERLLGDPKSHPIAPIVLVGAALEQHLRDLCIATGEFADTSGSIQSYKGFLMKRGLIKASEAAAIDYWRVRRNWAAHGSEKLTRDDALEMARGVRSFLKGADTAD